MRLFLTILILLVPLGMMAQESIAGPVPVDSVVQAKDNATKLQQQNDSLMAATRQRLDSLQEALKVVHQQLDSVQQSGVAGVEKLKDSLQQVLQKGQMLQQQLYERQQVVSAPLVKITEFQKNILPGDQLSGLSPPELPGALSLAPLSLKEGLPGVELPGEVIPATKLPPIPNTNKYVQELPNDFNKDQLPDLPQQQDLMGEHLPEGIPTKIDSSSFSGEAIDQQLNEQLLKQKDVADFQQQAGAEDPLKVYLQQDAKVMVQEQAGELSQESMSMDQVQKKAIDHFAGKQEALEKARGNLNKYKGRFDEVKSVMELPKNPLKRHPLMGVEWYKRIQPGLQWQLGKGDAFRIDIGPRLSYLVTDKLEIGAAAQARATIGKAVPSWASLNYDRVWGYNLFGSYEIRKGFYGQISYERLNTQVILLAGQQERSAERLWVEGLRVGAGKRYTIYKRLRGYSLIEYNFSPSIHMPYRQQLQVKMGVVWGRANSK